MDRILSYKLTDSLKRYAFRNESARYSRLSVSCAARYPQTAPGKRIAAMTDIVFFRYDTIMDMLITNCKNIKLFRRNSDFFIKMTALTYLIRKK